MAETGRASVTVVACLHPARKTKGGGRTTWRTTSGPGSAPWPPRRSLARPERARAASAGSLELGRARVAAPHRPAPTPSGVRRGALRLAVSAQRFRRTATGRGRSRPSWPANPSTGSGIPFFQPNSSVAVERVDAVHNELDRKGLKVADFSPKPPVAHSKVADNHPRVLVRVVARPRGHPCRDHWDDDADWRPRIHNSVRVLRLRPTVRVPRNAPVHRNLWVLDGGRRLDRKFKPQMSRRAPVVAGQVDSIHLHRSSANHRRASHLDHPEQKSCK